MTTHEVINQVPPLVGHDAADDPALLDGLDREGAGWAADELHELGRLGGRRAGAASGAGWPNEHPPVLRTHDRLRPPRRRGGVPPGLARADGVPRSTHGLHAAPWARRPAGRARRPRRQVLRLAPADAGHGCPISMTYAAVPALRHAPELAARYEPLLTATSYDFGLRAAAGQARDCSPACR